MNIALLSRTFATTALGGMERHTAWLANVLEARGHAVTIVCAREIGRPAPQYLTKASSIRIVGVDAPIDRWSVEWVRLTTVEVERLHPDIVVSQSTGAGHLTRRWPVVTHLHGNHVNEMTGAWATWGQSRTRTAVRRTGQLLWDYARWKPWEISRGRVIALTVRESTIARALYGVRSGRVSVIGNPVAGIFSQAVSERRLRIVFAGRFDPSKGASLAIDGFMRSGLARLGYELHLAGDGPDFASLSGSAQHGGESGRIHFHGTLPTRQLAELLSSAQIACFPSRRRESFSIGVLEAMAAGCAVVASAQAGVEDIVTHPMAPPGLPPASVIVPRHDPSAWSDALRGVASDSNRRASLGASARTIAKAFDENDVADAITAAYDQTLREWRTAYQAPESN